MNPIYALLFCLVATAVLFQPSTAFHTAPRPALLARTAQAGSSSSALNVFGNKKTSAAKAAEEEKYWQGEWVCKDCGYIYQRVSSNKNLYLEYTKDIG